MQAGPSTCGQPSVLLQEPLCAVYCRHAKQDLGFTAAQLNKAAQIWQSHWALPACRYTDVALSGAASVRQLPGCTQCEGSALCIQSHGGRSPSCSCFTKPCLSVRQAERAAPASRYSRWHAQLQPLPVSCQAAPSAMCWQCVLAPSITACLPRSCRYDQSHTCWQVHRGSSPSSSFGQEAASARGLRSAPVARVLMHCEIILMQACAFLASHSLSLRRAPAGRYTEVARSAAASARKLPGCTQREGSAMCTRSQLQGQEIRRLHLLAGRRR